MSYKMFLVTLLLFIFFSSPAQNHITQDLTTPCLFTSFGGCSNNAATTPAVCSTFNVACSNWLRSHGTPDASSGAFVELVSKLKTDGTLINEGIYTANSFIAGNNYDIYMTYNFYGISPVTATGSVNVYAASGVSSQPIVGCQDPIPTGPSKFPIYTKTVTNQNISENIDLQVAMHVPGYGQVWIYPTNVSQQVNLDLFSISVCPSCFAVTSYTSGVLPVQVNGKDITISIPAQHVNTLVEVTDAIYLNQGFSATSTGGVTFTAEISPTCAYSEIIESAQKTKLDSGNTADLNFQSLEYPTNSTATGLVIYPTVSKGNFTVSGSTENMADAAVIVLDATGRVIYRTYNSSATTLQIDLNNVSNGLYFVQIRKNASVTTHKIIVKR